MYLFFSEKQKALAVFFLKQFLPSERVQRFPPPGGRHLVRAERKPTASFCGFTWKA